VVVGLGLGSSVGVVSSTTTVGRETFVLHSGRLPVYAYADDSRSIVDVAHSLSQASVVAILEDDSVAWVSRMSELNDMCEKRETRLCFVSVTGENPLLLKLKS
jgi:hypothetical protein